MNIDEKLAKAGITGDAARYDDSDPDATTGKGKPGNPANAGPDRMAG